MDPFSRPSSWYNHASKEDVAQVLADASSALQQLARTPPAQQPAATKQLCKLLRAVQAAMQQGKAAPTAPTASLVPSLQALLSYGTREESQSPSSTAAHPQPLPALHRSPNKYVAPPARLADCTDPHTFSGSESSDSEQGGVAGASGKVRSLALTCMQLLIKANPKALHPLWTSLLPMSDAVSNSEGMHCPGCTRSYIPSAGWFHADRTHSSMDS